MSSPAADRFVRLCPTHGVAIEEKGTQLICPRGGHAVARWKVVDREKDKAVMAATVDPKARNGVEDMSQPMTRKSLQATTLPTTVAPQAPHPPTSTAKTAVLARWKGGDDAKNVLWIRLVRQHSKRAGDSYLVRWQRVDVSGKGTTGCSFVGAYAEPARTAYEAKIKEAEKDGWAARPVTTREIRLSPLPKAVKKGRS